MESYLKQKAHSDFKGLTEICQSLFTPLQTHKEEKIMAIFEGAGVALVTPFTESGEVNYEKLETLLEEQIAGGTDAIIACGTTR